MRYPKWAKPERRLHLASHMVSILVEWPQTFEIGLFDGQITSPIFEGIARNHIDYWVAFDRQEREALWQEEQRKMHADRRRIRRGQFDTVAKELFLARQPSHYLEAITFNPLTEKRVAKVRIPSSFVRLWVELPSKHAIRKARRYGKGNAQDVATTIAQAVRDYLSEAESDPAPVRPADSRNGAGLCRSKSDS